MSLFACGLFLNAAMNSAKQNAAKKAAAAAAGSAASGVAAVAAAASLGFCGASVDKVCSEPNASLADPKVPSPLSRAVLLPFNTHFQKEITQRAPVCLPTDAGRRLWAGQGKE